MKYRKITEDRVERCFDLALKLNESLFDLTDIHDKTSRKGFTTLLMDICEPMSEMSVNLLHHRACMDVSNPLRYLHEITFQADLWARFICDYIRERGDMSKGNLARKKSQFFATRFDCNYPNLSFNADVFRRSLIDIRLQYPAKLAVVRQLDDALWFEKSRLLRACREERALESIS